MKRVNNIKPLLNKKTHYNSFIEGDRGRLLLNKARRTRWLKCVAVAGFILTGLIFFVLINMTRI
ncbi:type IV secretory pathway component VirB8 [Endozoicomonas sp. NE40]|uniref:Type IV secretory pathway component VirB8 n=1 Tax=Endozoicomonas lisbonensis TaxID=3120522 RepID=A0ABV2SC98_9GAMM